MVKKIFFLDENQIKTATKFPDQIKNALDRSDILLAVIGPQWATINDSNGNPRIHDPDDWVRIEIETAIARKLPIIPILVNNASPVVASDLPSSIHEITLIQALPFHNEHNAFEHDIERLVVIIHDKHIDILCQKAKSFEAQKSKIALAYLSQAQAINSNRADIYENRAIYFSNEGKHKQAIKECKSALRLQPMNPFYHFFLGLNLLDTGNIFSAISSFNKAIELDPKNSEHYLYRAMAYVRQFKKSAVKRDLQIAAAVRE